MFATWRRFWSLTALFRLYLDFGVAHGSSVLSAKSPQEEQSKIEQLHTHISTKPHLINFYDLRSENTVKSTFCIYSIALQNLVPNKSASVCFFWPPTGGVCLISRSKGQPDVLIKPKG